jgi:hypothetical protein
MNGNMELGIQWGATETQPRQSMMSACFSRVIPAIWFSGRILTPLCAAENDMDGWKSKLMREFCT